MDSYQSYVKALSTFIRYMYCPPTLAIIIMKKKIHLIIPILDIFNQLPAGDYMP